MAKELPQLVIWDYDGTLAPTRDQIVPSFQAAFEYGLGRVVSDAEVLAWFGPTDEEVIRRHVPSERFATALRIFYERYRQLEVSASMFWDLRRILEQSQGVIRHAVLTNKGRMTTEIALKSQGIQPLLSMVVTGDDVAEPKPHPMGIHKILAQLGVDERYAVFVGDSPTDIQAAHRAHLPVAAVAYGGIHSAEDLLRHAPTWIVHHPQDVGTWLESMRPGALTVDGSG